jgi:UDP-N-acetylmuramyl pentapeptide phosphotransferase/UDP-N-acetylglucosamine-1-phosphate transferase
MIEFLGNLPYKTYIGLFLCSLFASYWLTPRTNWLARGLGLFNIARHNSAPTLGGLAVGIPFSSIADAQKPS